MENVDALKEIQAGLVDLLARLEALGVPTPYGKDDPLKGVPDVILGKVEACERYPEIYGTQHSLSWKLRLRHENGLMSYGAVTEFRAAPHKRPTLKINHKLYVAHQMGLPPKLAIARYSRDRVQEGEAA